MTSNIFSKIVSGEVPTNFIYQDDLVVVFKDISPKAPIHYLIIPRIEIPTVNDVKQEHEPILGRMITVAAKIAKQENIADSGYRLIINCNSDGGQEVYYLHMHILGGKKLGAMIAE